MRGGCPHRVEARPRFEDVVNAEERPHPRGEVRIEMTVEDCVADGEIAIPAAVVDELQRERGAGTDRLAVEIVAVLIVA